MLTSDEIAGWRVGLEALHAPMGRRHRHGASCEWAGHYLFRQLDRDRSLQCSRSHVTIAVATRLALASILGLLGMPTSASSRPLSARYAREVRARYGRHHPLCDNVPVSRGCVLRLP